MNKQKIYLAGLPRGGTTLISSVLGQHSKIIQMGESMYSGVLNPKEYECSCGKRPCQFLEKVYRASSQDGDIKKINKAYGIIDRIREPNKIPHKLTIQHDMEDINNEAEFEKMLIKACNGFDKLIDVYENIFGNFIFVDNTKEIIFAEKLVNKNWKIILITRDPRGIAWSSKKAGFRKNVPRPVSSKVPVYIDFAERASKLKNNENVIHARYEDFCNNPNDVAKQLCSFIGINYEAGMLNYNNDKGHTLMGNRLRFNRKKRTISIDLDWIDNLSKKELNLIIGNKKLVSLYTGLGYFLGENHECNKF